MDETVCAIWWYFSLNGIFNFKINVTLPWRRAWTHNYWLIIYRNAHPLVIKVNNFTDVRPFLKNNMGQTRKALLDIIARNVIIWHHSAFRWMCLMFSPPKTPWGVLNLQRSVSLTDTGSKRSVAGIYRELCLFPSSRQIFAFLVRSDILPPLSGWFLPSARTSALNDRFSCVFNMSWLFNPKLLSLCKKRAFSRLFTACQCSA